MRYSCRNVLFAAVTLVLGYASASVAQPVTQIVSPVNEAVRTTLTGNVRPEANAQNDRGAVSDSFLLDHMQLLLSRSQTQENALNQLISDQENPRSANFHKWLSAAQFGEQFGVSQHDLDAVTGWLSAHGFHVNGVSAGRMMIDFSGNAGQVREAFHTEIHNLSVNGVSHIANMQNPQIPTALAPAVAGIVSLNDFRPHANFAMKQGNPKFTGTCGSFGPCLALTPADLATIYNFSPLYSAGITGKGQTVVVIEDTDPHSASDWATFRSTFGLSGYAGTFNIVHPGTGCTDPGEVNSDYGFEAILDAEWAGAAAPDASIILASCKDSHTTFGGLIALENMLNSTTPPAIVSISYGECEAINGATANKAYYSTYQQGVAEGTTIFVSSGDEGAASCDADQTYARHGIGVSGFTSTPFDVSVGGTDFGDTYANCKGQTFPTCDSAYWSSTNSSVYGSALSYIPEIPWNDSCAGALYSLFQTGSAVTYGKTGFCNEGGYLTTVSGSGGPSGCATGTALIQGVVGNSCKGWPKPSYQSVFGNPADGVRDIPDVSLFASNGWWGHYYIVCDSDIAACTTGAPQSWAGGGGTSFASPIMAGVMALVEQKVASKQGNANSVFYQLAAGEYGASGSSSCNSSNGASVGASCIFYDVTAGDMDVNCTGQYNCYLPSGRNGVLSTSNTAYKPAYGTTPGWDFATGIGTINVKNLVNAWP